MFILFGTKGVTSTADEGSFHCPQCRGDRNYRLRTVRRFFTLFFLPVIPLNRLGEYIECDGCDGTFQPEVLGYDPNEEQRRIDAEFHGAIKVVMIHMLLADGVVDESEMAAMGQVLSELTGETPDLALLRQQVDSSAVTGRDPIAVAAEVAPMLNAAGREMVMRAAIMVALADGVLASDEERLLGKLANALEISGAHLKGLMMDIA
jgi:uncharacterized tellurite resistance protein B-like protein